MQNHAGYSFQCFVSMILGECNFKDDICYPDDILLWDSTVNMEVVLDKTQKCAGNIAQTNLALSAKKCKFGSPHTQGKALHWKNQNKTLERDPQTHKP